MGKKCEQEFFHFPLIPPALCAVCYVLYYSTKNCWNFCVCCFCSLSFLAYWTRNFNFEMCGSSFSCLLYVHTNLPPLSLTQQTIVKLHGFCVDESNHHLWFMFHCHTTIHYCTFLRKSFRLIYIPSSFYLLYAFICWWYWWWWWIITVLLWLFPLLFVIVLPLLYDLSVSLLIWLSIYNFYYFLYFAVLCCAVHYTSCVYR